MNPQEPAYLTNRAASYIALKRFRCALEDCQQALTLQMSSSSSNGASPPPPTKTILRLVRCQLALGSPTPALSALNPVLTAEPKNAQALQLKAKILDLEAHLRTLDSARAKKDWSHVRLALDKCLQSIEGEGSEVPTEWRLWKVEMELAKGNWDGANNAAKYAVSNIICASASCD